MTRGTGLHARCARTSLALILVFHAAGARAIEPAPADGARDEVEVVMGQVSDKGFPDIVLDFQVKKADGTPILNARREDFRVTESDRDVEVRQFQAPTEVKTTTVVLVVDRSQSMRQEDRIEALKEAVTTFLQVMPAGSRVAVIAFGSEVRQICPFTDDPERVDEVVRRLRPAGGTRFYDAVVAAYELIEAEPGRRAVVALTDGEDTLSQSADLESAIRASRREGVPLHTVAVGSEEAIASADLRRLADETRGRYLPAQNAAQLRGIYEELAKGLGSSYRLVYRSDRPLPDGTLRPIRVAYRASRKVAEAAVFIPGMIVPASGWSALFLVLFTGLLAMAAMPGWLARKAARSDPTASSEWAR